MWITVDKETHQITGEGSGDRPADTDGSYCLLLPPGYPETCEWSPDLMGFRDVLTLEQHRAQVWSFVKARRDQELLLAPTEHGVFNSDDASKARISGQISALREMEALGLPMPDLVHWRLADNSTASLTVMEFRLAALMIAQHEADVFAVSWGKEAEIKAADLQSIHTISVTAGWP